MNVERFQEVVWDANLQLFEGLQDPDFDVSLETMKMLGQLAQGGK
jgi:hypothetical protein